MLSTRSWLRTSTILGCCVSVMVGAGCNLVQTPYAPTAVPPTGTPSPTPAVRLAVQTALIPTVPATRVERRSHAGPRLFLSSYTGLPLAGALDIAGFGWRSGEEVKVTLASAGGSGVFASTLARVEQKGRFTTRLTIPALAPGWYLIVAISIDRDMRASAVVNYHVVLPACVIVHYSAHDLQSVLVIKGHGFIAKSSLAIFLDRIGGISRQLGLVHVDHRGNFKVSTTIARLQPGQYRLRTQSASGVTIQNTSAFFEVLF
jgi:hypothetical protein